MADDEETGSLHIRVRSATFADDPDDAEAFYAEIGRLAFVWGRLESMVDGGIMTIRDLSDATGLDPKFPTAFSAKIRYWRRAFGTLNTLRNHQSFALKLADALADLSEQRNFVLHANYQGFQQSDPLAALAVSLRWTRGYNRRNMFISLPYLHQLRQEIDNVGMHLAWFVFTIRMIEPIDLRDR